MIDARQHQPSAMPAAATSTALPVAVEVLRHACVMVACARAAATDSLGDFFSKKKWVLGFWHVQ
jgi:hypothetical protein